MHIPMPDCRVTAITGELAQRACRASRAAVGAVHFTNEAERDCARVPA